MKIVPPRFNRLMFALREVPQASTGFSPIELLYGRPCPQLSQVDLGGPTMPILVHDRTCYPDEGPPVGSVAHSEGAYKPRHSTQKGK